MNRFPELDEDTSDILIVVYYYVSTIDDALNMRYGTYVSIDCCAMHNDGLCSNVVCEGLCSTCNVLH